MQRIIADLYAETLEGVVVDGLPLNETSADFDLECEFIFAVRRWCSV